MVRSEHFGHVCYMDINVLEVGSSVLSVISEWIFEHVSFSYCTSNAIRFSSSRFQKPCTTWILTRWRVSGSNAFIRNGISCKKLNSQHSDMRGSPSRSRRLTACLLSLSGRSRIQVNCHGDLIVADCLFLFLGGLIERSSDSGAWASGSSVRWRLAERSIVMIWWMYAIRRVCLLACWREVLYWICKMA